MWPSSNLDFGVGNALQEPPENTLIMIDQVDCIKP